MKQTNYPNELIFYIFVAPFLWAYKKIKKLKGVDKK